MDRKYRLVRIRHPLAQRLDERAELMRQVVAHRVGDVHRARAGIDHGLEYPAKEVGLRAAGVLRREFDIVGVLARALDHRHRAFQNLFRRHAQFVLHMDRARGEKGMDTPAFRGLDRLGGTVNILFHGARQGAYGAVLHFLGHRLHRLEVTEAGHGKSGLDDVDAHAFQHLGDAYLFLARHGRAGTLLAVAQRRVKNDQWIVHGIVSARIVNMIFFKSCGLKTGSWLRIIFLARKGG